MSTFGERVVRASRLDAQLYEEVEADKQALGQAMAVVVLSAVAGGLGSYSAGGVAGIVGGTIGSLIGWYIWAFMTYFIGTRLLPELTTECDMGEMLRTLGFASAPGLIRVIGIVESLAPIVMVVASIWMLAAMIIAVRQALDYTSTWRAIGVCFIGWVVQGIVLGFILFAVAGSMVAGGPQV